jgi:hypothetical protein
MSCFGIVNRSNANSAGVRNLPRFNASSVGLELEPQSLYELLGGAAGFASYVASAGCIVGPALRGGIDGFG